VCLLCKLIFCSFVDSFYFFSFHYPLATVIQIISKTYKRDGFMRLTALMITWMLSSTVFAAPVVFDSYRQELKKMAVKGHNPITSYTVARTHMFGKLDLKQDHKGYYVVDVYCGTTFRKNIRPGNIPNHEIVNTEHTWPQSKFSKSHRKNVQKSDLHHLFPTDSKANSIRGNHNFTELKGGTYAYKGCRLSQVGNIQATGRIGFMPPNNHKGNVARALFYFSVRYDIAIPDYEEIILRQWNWMDPVDDAEMLRNKQIAEIQGNSNPFVEDAENAELIADF
jgi:deoxyribonuclease-1